MFGWKNIKFAINASPEDIGGAVEGMIITGQSGFIAGTHVASNAGWRAVEKLSVGDKVLTFDHGMQSVVDIQREVMTPPENAMNRSQNPILVPMGAMNNRKEMWLMPDQGMLIESESALDAMGDPFAVVPARALKGLRGIRRAPAREKLSITTLAFASDEVVYVECGMLAYCPRPRNILTDPKIKGVALYDVLGLRAARFLVECLIDDDNGGALICDPDEIAGVRVQKERTERPSAVMA